MGVLSIACQEDTICPPFTTIPPSVQMGGRGVPEAFTYGARCTGRRCDDTRAPAHLWPLPAGDTPGELVARRPPDSPAAAVPGDVALSGRASWSPGDQSRGAATRLGGHACHAERAAGVCPGDSGGPGGLGRGAAVPRDGRTAGLSLARGRGTGGPPSTAGGPPGGAPGRGRAPGGVGPAGGPRHPPARLRQWGSGGREDDGGRDGPGPAGRRGWGADGAGAVRRAHGGGRTVLALPGSVAAAGPRARAGRGVHRAAAVCAAVAGAPARLGQCVRTGATPGPPAGGDAGPNAARTRRGLGGADGRPGAGAGAGRLAVE